LWAISLTEGYAIRSHCPSEAYLVPHEWHIFSVSQVAASLPNMPKSYVM